MRLSWKYLKWREMGTFDKIRLGHSLANAVRSAREGRCRVFKIKEDEE